MAQNASPSELDANQIIQRGYEDADDQHRVVINAIDPSVIIPVSAGSFSVLGSFKVPYSSISHTGPHTITSGLSSAVKSFLIADTTGHTMSLAWGAVTMYTNPGCEHQVDASIAANTAITIQSQEAADPTAGAFIITMLG